MDTVFALASARGKAGVSVIRISGPEARSVFRVFGTEEPRVRTPVLRVLNGSDGPIDQVLALRFDGPNSFTGEDVVELQTHGSVAIVNAILSRLSGESGFRLACH